MISIEEWNARIDAFVREENTNIGKKVPVRRIFCQDDTDRSGGGIYNETVTLDTIGRFARALGDSNPLFSDPRYRPGGGAGIMPASTLHSGPGAAGPLQAPPLLECCICSTFIGGKMPRLRGISVYDAGTKWERFLPICPGDSFSAQTTFLGVTEVSGNASAGVSAGASPAARLLLREHQIDLTNQRGEHVSRLTARSIIKCAPPLQNTFPDLSADSAGVRNESRKTDYGTVKANSGSRELSAETTAAAEQDPKGGRPHYTEAELERVYANLDMQLAGRFRRGPEPRYWEDVEIGQELPEEIVGPYDESDGQALMAAIGAANAFATKWAAIRFRKGQGVTDPLTGAHRHPIDRHYSDTMARAQGLPRAIVSGIHSQALLAKSVSDWMGDFGFLRSLDCRCRKPLYFGDISFQRGRVTGRFEKEGNYYAELELEAVRQDGTRHTTAKAIVRLPSRRD